MRAITDISINSNGSGFTCFLTYNNNNDDFSFSNHDSIEGFLDTLIKNDDPYFPIETDKYSLRINGVVTIYDLPQGEFTYLLTQRPPSIGTHPDGQIKDVEETKLGDRTVYRVTYNKPVSDDELRRFEMIPEFTKDLEGKKFSRKFGRGELVYTVNNVDLENNSISFTESFNGKDIEESFGFRKFYSVLIDLEPKQ